MEVKVKRFYPANGRSARVLSLVDFSIGSITFRRWKLIETHDGALWVSPPTHLVPVEDREKPRYVRLVDMDRDLHARISKEILVAWRDHKSAAS